MGKPTVDPGGASEQERFAALIREHYQVLYRAAYRLTRSEVDAEDLVQEVCVRAYPRIGELERLEQPRGWLLRVLFRLFVDLRRRYERKNVRAIDENEEPTLVVARSRLPSGAIDLRTGDELLTLGKEKRALDNQSDLVHALRGGLDDVTLAVRRDGAEVTLHGNWPAASRVIERKGVWISGALIAESEPMIRGQIQGGPKLMIHHVQSGSAAQVEGLQEYDLVLSANGRPYCSMGSVQTVSSKPILR